MDTAIAIRTAIVKDHTLYVQAGAGVVADSVAESEWQETLNKARSIFRAVALAEAGLGLDGTRENVRAYNPAQARKVVGEVDPAL
jgi:anthranilate synthase component 1